MKLLALVLALLGAAMIVVLFFGSAFFGIPGGAIWHMAGWLVCGVYTVMVTKIFDAPPESLDATCAVIIGGPPILLVFIVGTFFSIAKAVRRDLRTQES